VVLRCREGCIYLWPPDEEEPNDELAVGALTELVRVEGDIQPEGGGDHPARDIEFRGLTFAHGERISRHGRTGEGECSASIRWDEVDALLGEDYERVAWHRPERWREDWLRREPLMHRRDNRIERNDIHHVMEIMGDGNGVYVSGAGGGNQVCHNVVHDCPSPSLPRESGATTISTMP
jgi:hypothetical protein